MHSNTKDIQVKSYKKFTSLLQVHGCNPKLLKFDNITLNFLKEFWKDQNISFELTPPNLHQKHSIESTIRTF